MPNDTRAQDAIQLLLKSDVRAKPQSDYPEVFQGFYPKVQDVFQLFEGALNYTLNGLDREDQTEIKTTVDEITYKLNEAFAQLSHLGSTYGPQVNQQTFSQAIDEIRKKANALVPTLTKAVLLTPPKQNDTDEAVKKVQEAKAKAETLLRDIEEKASKHIVIENANSFGDSAKRYSISCTKWRIFGYVLSLILFGGAYCSYNNFLNYKGPATPLALLPILLAHAAAAGIIVYLMSISFRNAAADKHNEVLNLHRNNALNSFKILYDAANDDASKGAILAQAAQAIFTAQDTGYISNGGDTVQIGQIGDAVKGLIGK